MDNQTSNNDGLADSASASPHQLRLQCCLPALAIALVTLIAYLPALRGGFVWDDNDYVTANPTLRSAAGLRQIWFDPGANAQYYPLTYAIFWVQYHLWGLNPFGFHLVNVLLQAANAILFWRLLSRLRIPGAWWAAAIFALHPVHVMSVAWITELKNVLSGLFYLGALLLYIRSCGPDGDEPDQPTGRQWSYGLALALYLCALFSKTSTSMLPVALLLIQWWKRGRIGRNEWKPLLPFFAMGILFGGFTLWLEKYAKGASGSEFTLSFPERFLVAGRAFWFSLCKLLWPVQLTFIYPRWQVDPRIWWQYLFPLGAIALVVALWWARHRVGRAPLAAVLYFSLAFPVLVIVEVLYMMRYSFVSDHWQYLGSMSVIPLVVGGAATALRRWAPASRRVGPVIGTVVLATLGLLTWRHGHIYQDLETLWQDTLAKNPSAWIASNNLGGMFVDQGRFNEAIESLQQAIRFKSDDAGIHNNLGSAFFGLGRNADAAAQYRKAIRLKPDFAEAHYNLGNALSELGQLDEAAAQYAQAILLAPDYAAAHYNLANTLLRQNLPAAALEHYRLAARLRPADVDAQYALANALAQQGDLAGATASYQQALRLKPDFGVAHYNLANTLVRLGRLDEAIAQYRQALALQPDLLAAQFNLGTTLLVQGNAREAIEHFQHVLAFDPDQPETHYKLGVAFARLGEFDSATNDYGRALHLKPDLPQAQADLAWLLATYAGVTPSDAQRAVALAARACQLTDNQEPAYLDALAAALARVGQFPQAIETANQALQLADKSGTTDLARQIQSRLELYRHGHACQTATGTPLPSDW